MTTEIAGFSLGRSWEAETHEGLLREAVGMTITDTAVAVHLLRHGEVLNHRGDVPITESSAQYAEQVGARLHTDGRDTVVVMCGETRRARETATHLSAGLERAGTAVDGPTVAHALRNPDLYLGGHRVNMVSSHEAFAAQVPGLQAEEVADLDFFPDFVVQPDRIGWWLRHPSPPGEGATPVADRLEAFARSFLNPYRPDRPVVVAVTHSPLLRAVGLRAFGRDIGEPDWVAGLTLGVDHRGDITTTVFSGGG